MKRKMAHGEEGVRKFTQLMSNSGNVVLDIGAGEECTHANYMMKKRLIVETVDFFDSATHKGDYNKIQFDKQYDGIHAAHVLEHQLNPNLFLKKVHFDLKEGGWLCITVPPLKHQIVGGHVSLWNAGLVLYHLVLAGFDCIENVIIKEYGYNISVIVKKKSIQNFPELTYDGMDLVILNKYFPKSINYNQYGCFNGDIKNLT